MEEPTECRAWKSKNWKSGYFWVWKIGEDAWDTKSVFGNARVEISWIQTFFATLKSLNFNNFWNINIWTLYDVVLKFAHPEFWFPKKLEFLNLSFNLRTLRMSQNIEKLAINYHFQISKNESINFTNWRGRLNVEHEKQETENWC